MEKAERLEEEKRLNVIINKVDENVDYLKNSKKFYMNKLKSESDENKVKVISQYLSIIDKNLAKIDQIINSPYFARIDYVDYADDNDFSLYIGKHGVQDKDDNTVIVDWRAPISSAYYDCQLGENTIQTYEDNSVTLDLKLKRTYEIRNRALIDFYDLNTIANDELLNKYLAKNKEAVLSDIVATIQKDQNDIIRHFYAHNVIVQGGAGSGKTTVAMHRISYLLYNYKNVFEPEHFYVLGSNKMFLNYITSILPSLDVENIQNMVLSTFLHNFIKTYLPKGKSKFRFIDKPTNDEEIECMSLKGKIGFVKSLDKYLFSYEKKLIPVDDVIIKGKVIMSKANILDIFKTFKYKSIYEKIELLNEQLDKKIDMAQENYININFKTERRNFKNYFGNKKEKINLINIYLEFLDNLIDDFSENEKLNHLVHVVDHIVEKIKDNNFDLFDLAMLNLIKKRVCINKEYEKVKYIVVDEAQDFGVSIFYVLKNVFTKAYFSIMGDVAQNINYDTGMNDWDALTKKVFCDKGDIFFTLNKSYRNTIEISNLASSVLKKATFSTYPVEPFARHGDEVLIEKANDNDDMASRAISFINKAFDKGHKTIGVICKDENQTSKVAKMLSKFIQVSEIDGTDIAFSNGVMVLPIKLSKGLEFDAVVLWDTNDENYQCDDRTVKLMYVGITRALHDLYIVYTNNITKLLE